MTESTEMTISNVVVMSLADAVKAVRAAGNAEHGSHSALAHALIPVMEQAYQGNLDPAYEIAGKWTDAARKAANSILAHFTGGALKIRAATPKHKGASLAKGWADDKVENFNFVELSTAITVSMPKNSKGDSISHRANIYKVAKALKEPAAKVPDTIAKLAARTVTSAVALHVIGVTDDMVTEAINKAFAEIVSISEAAIKAAHEVDKPKGKGKGRK